MLLAFALACVATALSPPNAAQANSINPAPTVTAITPATGDALGGTAVTISGTGFTGATGVTIGGAAATGVTVVNDTTITATTPAGSAPAGGLGTASVVVTTANGSNTANSLFSYFNTPVITGVTFVFASNHPNVHSCAGNDCRLVTTVSGRNFTGATSLSFRGLISAGSTPAPGDFVVQDDNTIIVIDHGDASITPYGYGNDIVFFSVSTPQATSNEFRFVLDGGFSSFPPLIITQHWRDVQTGYKPSDFPFQNQDGYGFIDSIEKPPALGSVVLVQAHNPDTDDLNNYNFEYTPVPQNLKTVFSDTFHLSVSLPPFAETLAVYVFVTNTAPVLKPLAPIAITNAQVARSLKVDDLASDPDADPLSFAAIPTLTPANCGSIAKTSDTEMSFTPAAGFVGQCSVNFSATDGVHRGTYGPLDAAAGTQVFNVTADPTAPTAPTVTAISPATGLPSGGTVVTVTGTGFTATSTVKFGALDATAVVFNSATSLTATSPAGVAGMVDITVTSATGTSSTSAADHFTYAKAMQTVAFTSAIPANPLVGGTYTPAATGGAGTAPVVLSVSDLCSLANGVVTFNAAGPCVVSANQAGDGNYEAAAQVQQVITVPPPVGAPTVTSIAPNTGLPSGGTSVTLTGTGFTGATSVTFDGAPLSAFTFVNDTTITIVTPAGDAGSKMNVQVVTPAGSNADNALFQYVKGAQVVAFTSTAPTSPIVGGTYTPVATGGAGSAPVVFSVGGTACSVSSGVVSFTGVGTCIVSADQAADTNYSAATKVQQSIAVGKAAQTVAFTSTAPASPIVGGTYSPTATGGGSSAPVAFSVGGTACSLAGGVVTFVSAGVCTVSADQAGDDKYEAATQIQQSITVGKNEPPVADAGSNQSVTTRALVTLDGSKSSDPENGTLTYSWKQTVGTTATLSDVTAAMPTFAAPILATGITSEELTFELTVADDTGSTSVATVKVTVNQPVTATLALQTPNPVTGQVNDLIFTLIGTQSGSLQPLHMFAVISPVAPLLQLAGIAPPPAATVAFFMDGNPIAGCTQVPLGSNNVAICPWTAVAGQHSFSAKVNNSNINAVAVTSNQVIVATTNQAVTNSTAIGGFLSDRANQLITNLPGMDRQIDRLNAAQQAQAGSDTPSNFAAADKGDLMLNPSRLGSGPTGTSITAARLGTSAGSALGPSSVGEQDMMGFQSFLYNYLKTSGESGNLGQFNFSGPMEMQANFGADGGHAAFKASLSKMMEWQQQRDQKEMAALGFGKSGGAGNSMPLDIWTEGVYSSYSGARSGAFGMATLGADYVFNPNFLAGFYGQFDLMSQTSGTALSGKGWMIGPYATARLGENVFWQGRAGWGKSSNDITPSPAGTDNFGTTRWLVSSSLSGKWTFGDGWAFAPTASFTYFDDRSEAYVDHFGTTIPSVDTNLGQLKLSPELSYGFMTDNDLWIEPSLATEFIWNFTSTNVDGLGSLNGDATGPTGLRGRVKAGLNVRMLSGIAIGATGSYDGIGSGSYSAISGHATVTVPLN
ncbi:IPT/TIG domain-containing protein [Aestuariivirga litoralis]|uniref:IPT/TIG domain-containing protein n=1 Tax=Aestuariivirga litoralis TaxID=2650924 RepID=UPI0018C4D1B9